MGVIDIQNISFSYGSKKVLDSISLELNEGRILGLLGPNGVGKSTLINIINGFLEPDEGTIRIFGKEAGKLAPREKMRIAYLMEGHIQYNFMTTSEAERFYSSFYPSWNSALYNSYIRDAKIESRQKIGTMSRGQRSKVALAILMAQNPDLLILDDFSMGLDPVYRQMFINDLSQFARDNNKTVFVTSHIIQDMEKLIDDVAILGLDTFTGTMPVKAFKAKHKNKGSSLDDIFVNLFINRQ